MRHSHSDVRTQLDSAFSGVESALRNLSDRLEDVLPDYGRRTRIARAGRAIRRTASSVADRVTPQHGMHLVEDTRRTVQEHPFGTMLTAAAAGFLVWSAVRMANSRHELRNDEGRTLAGRFRAAQEEGVMRH